MHSDKSLDLTFAFDPNATGAMQPLPHSEPGAPGRETHEREAALARGDARAGESPSALCAPGLPGSVPTCCSRSWPRTFVTMPSS
jgi:hypothetical protein